MAFRNVSDIQKCQKSMIFRNNFDSQIQKLLFFMCMYHVCPWHSQISMVHESVRVHVIYECSNLLYCIDLCTVNTNGCSISRCWPEVWNGLLKIQTFNQEISLYYLVKDRFLHFFMCQIYSANVVSHCHQYRTRPTCTSMQSDQALYCQFNLAQSFILVVLKFLKLPNSRQGKFITQI
jgi:hypothetical protein